MVAIKIHPIEDGGYWAKGRIDPSVFLDACIAWQREQEETFDDWDSDTWKEDELPRVKHEVMRIIPTAPSWEKSDDPQRDPTIRSWLEASKPGRGAFEVTILY